MGNRYHNYMIQEGLLAKDIAFPSPLRPIPFLVLHCSKLMSNKNISDVLQNIFIQNKTWIFFPHPFFYLIFRLLLQRYGGSTGILSSLWHYP